jgi:tetratricopeptide (TPR) repeat protein
MWKTQRNLGRGISLNREFFAGRTHPAHSEKGSRSMVDNSSRFTKGVILVVACDGSQGEELHEMLQGAGYQVVVTSGGQRGRDFELADKQLAVLFCPRDRWAHQLDPLSPDISVEVGLVHIDARRFDEAIVVCKKVANENPTFATAHICLASAYWGKHMYPQVIEERKVYGRLSGDRKSSEYAFAMEEGFRSGGWQGALSKGIEASLAQRKAGYSPPYNIATLYAELGDKEQAFEWLNTTYQEHGELLMCLNVLKD